MDRVVEVARDRLSLERGVSVLCRAFFYLENGCIQRVSDGRLKIMMPRVGGVGKISLGGCCYGGVGNVVYDKVIS